MLYVTVITGGQFYKFSQVFLSTFWRPEKKFFILGVW
jgi:hypothetical protein